MHLKNIFLTIGKGKYYLGKAGPIKLDENDLFCAPYAQYMEKKTQE